MPKFRTWPMAALDPQPTSTTDGYPVVQSNDGPTGIPGASASKKSPLHPCQNLHLKCQHKVGRFLMEFDLC